MTRADWISRSTTDETSVSARHISQHSDDRYGRLRPPHGRSVHSRREGVLKQYRARSGQPRVGAPVRLAAQRAARLCLAPPRVEPQAHLALSSCPGGRRARPEPHGDRRGRSSNARRSACRSFDCQGSQARADDFKPRETPCVALTIGAGFDRHRGTPRCASKRASTSWTIAPRIVLISKSFGV